MKITVFTPAYNRAYTLGRLYASLLRQTYGDFEWLVVDDGSTDDTPALLERMQAEGKLDMRHCRVANGGKHRAIDIGAQKARGELLFIVDSDDYLADHALERIAFHYENVRGDASFGGVAGRRAHPDGRTIGSRTAFGVRDCTSTEYRVRYRMRGDMAEVLRTEVVRRYPFPDYEGEKFCAEDVLFRRIAREYRLRWFDENIYICEYLPDGLTAHIRRRHRESPRYSMLSYGGAAKDPCNGFMARLRAGINYWRYTIRYRGPRRGELGLPWWGYALWPAGLAFYGLDLRRMRSMEGRP